MTKDYGLKEYWIRFYDISSLQKRPIAAFCKPVPASTYKDIFRIGQIERFSNDEFFRIEELIVDGDNLVVNVRPVSLK